MIPSPFLLDVGFNGTEVPPRCVRQACTVSRESRSTSDRPRRLASPAAEPERQTQQECAEADRVRADQPRERKRAGPGCQHRQGAEDDRRSEEHTSELQSQSNLVCRLLLEKKKTKNNTQIPLRKQHKPT